MQNNEVIQPSSSPWVSLVDIIRKKDGSHCFYWDYRQLNAVMKVNTYTLPRVDDLQDQLGECTYSTILDLPASYWEIQFHEQC